MVKAWEGLYRNGRVALRTNVIALENYSKVISHPKFIDLGVTVDDVALIAKKDITTGGAVYQQELAGYGFENWCEDLVKLIDAFPTGSNKVQGFKNFIGSQGMNNASGYTRRHAYYTMKRLTDNEVLIKQVDELTFERTISNNLDGQLVTSVTDVHIRVGERRISIETKAGMDFFEGVNGSVSNFTNQSFNSILEANSLNDWKVFLNPTIRNNLTTVGVSSDKIKVINAWKNGGLLNDQRVVDKIKAFDSQYDFNLNSVEDFLNDTDIWFNRIFKEDF